MPNLKKFFKKPSAWILLSALFVCSLSLFFWYCTETPETCGDGKSLNPNAQFCYDNRTYEKCGGQSYNPPTQYCYGDAVYDKCGGNDLNPNTQFCFQNVTYDKCAGEAYNPNEKGCTFGVIKDKCGRSFYDNTIEFCYANRIYDRNSNGQAYVPTDGDPAKCGINYYDPGTAFCIGDGTLPLCRNENNDFSEYEPETHFCDGMRIYEKCGGEVYNTVTEKCENGTIILKPVLSGYTLDVTVEPQGTGDITLVPNNAYYSSGAYVVVTATPREGYWFDRWSGADTSKGSLTSSIGTRTIHITGDLELTANFIPRYTLTVNVVPEGGGTVSLSPNPTPNSTSNQTDFKSGTQVTVKATTVGKYKFNGWTGASISQDSTMIITVDSNMTLTANFLSPCTLTTNVTPSSDIGTVSVVRQKQYAPVAELEIITERDFIFGTQVTVIAASKDADYGFSGWSVNAMDTDSTNRITITMNGNMALTANFEKLSTFTDSRDQKTYKMVKIGSQTWMAENLNYQTADSSWCYNDADSNCVKYGRLYSWAKAMNLPSSYNSRSASSQVQTPNHQGICPVGWHLPTRQEWTTLVNYAKGTGYDSSGTKLKARSFGGTDDYSFSALPGGTRYNNGAFGLGLGGSTQAYGHWWTVTERDASSAYRRNMFSVTSDVDESIDIKDYGLSVRCVRDD
jgi:uncharacterized protein (TIGR02145 family)